MLGPIFNREFLTVPRRSRHYVERSLYLLILWVLALTAWQATFGWGRTISQGDLAFFGTFLFQLLSGLELVLVLFFAALFAAAAITLEKDRRTFVLLLLTDMRNYEIVLGKLLGSLLRIGALVACAVPVLSMTMLLGGVAFHQVGFTFLILACSALAAGALGNLLALWREKTFQTLALTVLSLVLYLLLVEGLGAIPEVAAWRARLSPLHALSAVIEQQPTANWLEIPAVAYSGIMLIATTVLAGLGIWKLRVWNPSGEPVQQPDNIESVEQAPAKKLDIHASPGKARPVWPNPILWREMWTRAYGHKTLMIKAVYLLVFGLICYGVVWELPAPERANRLAVALSLVPVTVLSLLLLNAQAVTSVTTERDLKALELLLVSDLTPREFLFGKLGGVFYNAKEIVLPPLLLTLAFAWWGYVGWETCLYLEIALIVLLAFTATLGLHIALRKENTRLAIGQSLGTIFFLFIGTLISIYLILVSGRFEEQWTSFVFFLAIGIGGLWVILGGTHPSAAITVASIACPLGMFYTVTSVLIGDPRTGKAGDPLWPFLVVSSAFGFTVAAMLVPLLSEFDVALGYKTPAEE
jgi:ABC-type transport system involved in multi-copper enzyme maturation permease subunit